MRVYYNYTYTNTCINRPDNTLTHIHTYASKYNHRYRSLHIDTHLHTACT